VTGDVVIRAEGLGKKYLIGHQSAERPSTFRDAIVHSARGWGRSARDMIKGAANVAGDEIEEFWALKDVSFEINRGDVVGIIGRNGAGKSTLLKVLSRITEPSEGRVEIKGRIASLLEVGTGFHPELSGRENIYLNGAILGMSRDEIKRKFDEIVDFAEIEKFLDTPVKRYSSGMYVRLAFAVAAHLDPEILIVDEVLAVGDAEFQKKCLGKMQDVAGHGRTVLFVSHNMTAIERLCTSGLLLDKGSIGAAGPIGPIVDSYLSYGKQVKPSMSLSSGSAVGLTTIDQRNFPSIEFSLVRPHVVSDLSVLVYSKQGVRVAILDLRDQLSLPHTFAPGSYRVELDLRSNTLVEGSYDLGIYCVLDGQTYEELNLFPIVIKATSIGRLPYPAQHRGYVQLDFEAQLTQSEFREPVN